MPPSFFADSGFLIGYYYEKDGKHDISMNIYDYLIGNRLIRNLNNFCISNYIIIEVIHWLQSKPIPHTEIVSTYNDLMRFRRYDLIQPEIQQAIDTKLTPFCNHKTGKPPIGLVDATNLYVMDQLDIRFLISYDSGFDQVPDPLKRRINDINAIDTYVLKR